MIRRWLPILATLALAPLAMGADEPTPAEPPAAPVDAAEAGTTEPPPIEAPPPITDDELAADDTIVVISDPFARWDGTRWFIKTEVGLPIPMVFYADENYEFVTNAFQVRTILACEKDWKLSKKSYQVNCTIEDFGIQAADEDDLKTTAEIEAAEARVARRAEKGLPAVTETKEKRRERVQGILDEVDGKLTGAAMQLQVGANGRVTNIDLEGVNKSDRRSAGMHETLRLVMSRVIVGFDMKLDDYHFLETGFWTEYNPALMAIPVQNDTSMGNSMLIHRLDRYEGQLVVESRGKGNVSNLGNNWQTSFAGVAVYDNDDAYMTERVWVMKGTPTASSWLDMPYWHAGRIIQLDPEQKPSVGATRMVTMPCCPAEGVAEWQALEE